MSRAPILLLVAAACGSSGFPEQKRAPKPSWPLPAGWRYETIPFPLEFAPWLGHQGVEELRFPPGFLEPATPGYFSYAFVWRTEEPAELDAAALGKELTVYFRGLIATVDEKEKRINARDEIAVAAVPAGPSRFELQAHIFDPFKTGLPVELTGFAERIRCEKGAVWRFVLAPEKSGFRAELTSLASSAQCGQKPL